MVCLEQAYPPQISTPDHHRRLQSNASVPGRWRRPWKLILLPTACRVESYQAQAFGFGRSSPELKDLDLTPPSKLIETLQHRSRFDALVVVVLLHDVDDSLHAAKDETTDLPQSWVSICPSILP